jgi:beta-glucoside operon transcriptional antiterminator
VKIVKILNNNAAVCTGADGQEVIAMGRGLAFQLKSGMIVDESRVEKLFALKSSEINSRFQQIIKEIPVEDILLSEKIITYAKKHSAAELDDSIYITLTDHLSAALERARRGIAVTNPLTGAIKSFYPAEFQLGLDALSMIKTETGISFSLDEVAFITMHFVTAQLGVGTPEFTSVLAFVNDVSCIVKEDLAQTVDESTPVWQRFLTHLAFFAQRIMSGKEFADREALLFDSVSRTFPQASSCVKKIVTFIKNTYSFTVGEDEQTYLMIHINRLQLECGVKNRQNTTEV